jgi:MHS family proline/betaine transporter-like MFS transporter
MLSIVLMTAGTAIMAFVPTYATIGLLAPVLVFASRLMQGFSAGGEFGSSTAFMTEHGAARKGFLGSWQFSSQGISVTLAALSGFVLTGLLSQEQMSAWGWRVPFVFGLLIGPVGFYIRRYVDETPEFVASERTRTPVREILADQKLRTLLAIGAVGMSTSANYLILYMPTFAIRDLGLPHWTGFLAATVGGVMLTVVAPVIGHWSDAVGRTRIMIGVTLLFLLTALPAFAVVTAYPWTMVLVLVVAWVAILKASYSGALPALMSEVFPTRTRGTGMSFAYNVGVTLFGGFAPTIIAALIRATGTNLAPSFYLMFVACLSLATLVLARRLLQLC